AGGWRRRSDGCQSVAFFADELAEPRILSAEHQNDLFISSYQRLDGLSVHGGANDPVTVTLELLESTTEIGDANEIRQRETALRRADRCLCQENLASFRR